MRKEIFFRFVIAVGLIPISMSCKKDWLDIKPQKSLVIPKTLADYQSLLDNTSLSQGVSAVGFNINQGAISEYGTTDFYVTDAIYNGRTVDERNVYIWSPTVTEMNGGGDWSYPYSKIFY